MLGCHRLCFQVQQLKKSVHSRGVEASNLNTKQICNPQSKLDSSVFIRDIRTEGNVISILDERDDITSATSAMRGYTAAIQGKC